LIVSCVEAAGFGRSAGSRELGVTTELLSTYTVELLALEFSLGFLGRGFVIFLRLALDCRVISGLNISALIGARALV
jgi:hypothetical protein